MVNPFYSAKYVRFLIFRLQNVSLFEFIEEWEVNWMNIEELIDILDLEDLDIVDDTFDYWM